MVAAAAREVEVDLEGDGASRPGMSGEAVGGKLLVWWGEEEVEREGGRELRSGAILRFNCSIVMW